MISFLEFFGQMIHMKNLQSHLDELENKIATLNFVFHEISFLDAQNKFIWSSTSSSIVVSVLEGESAKSRLCK